MFAFAIYFQRPYAIFLVQQFKDLIGYPRQKPQNCTTIKTIHSLMSRTLANHLARYKHPGQKKDNKILQLTKAIQRWRGASKLIIVLWGFFHPLPAPALKSVLGKHILAVQTVVSINQSSKERERVVPFLSFFPFFLPPHVSNHVRFMLSPCFMDSKTDSWIVRTTVGWLGKPQSLLNYLLL